ncbi:MAG: PPC domain-containing protein, partial [Chloroflexota bacterium]
SAAPILAAPPAGESWKEVSQQAIGLQIAVPPEWVSLATLPPALSAAGPWQPGALFLADSRETGDRLLAGRELGQGAFVLGIVAATPAAPDPALADPLAILQALVEGVVAPSQVKQLTQNAAPGAYVDAPRDPMGLFPALAAADHLRITLLISPQTGIPVFFLFGTGEANWPAAEPLFNRMVASVVVQSSLAASNPSPTAPQVVGNLNSGDQVNGVLASGATDFWTFTAEGGRYATITVFPDGNNLDLTLVLLSPSNKTIKSVDGGYAGDLETMLDVYLAESGLYQIGVAEFFDEPGRYMLGLALTDQPQFSGGGRIEMGQQVTADLQANQEHFWLFNAIAGQTVSVILEPLNEQLDVILDLRGPDGSRLAALDEGFSGDAEVLNGFSLPVTGEYTIRVVGFADHAGQYALSLDEGREEAANFWEAGTLVYGDRRREVLQAKEVHAWYFSGRAGEEVTIVVTPIGPNMDLELWLLDPNVDRLSNKDDFLSNEPETIRAALPADGHYTILIREFFGEAGEYEISLDERSDVGIDTAGGLAYGQSVHGRLRPGRGAAWSFNGAAGDTIAINLIPLDNNSDLIIVLQDPQGQTVAEVDETVAGSPEKLLAYTLTVSGVWTIQVQEFFEDSARYELNLLKVEG